MAQSKTISRGDYLKAFALYTMASSLQKDVDRFNTELLKLLDIDAPDYVDSRLTDGIYARPPEPFDRVLAHIGISVEADTQA